MSKTGQWVFELQQQQIEEGNFHFDPPELSPVDFAEAQPEWNSVLGAAIQLVMEAAEDLDAGRSMVISEAFNAARGVAVDAVIGKREPTREEVFDALGSPLLDADPFGIGEGQDLPF